MRHAENIFLLAERILVMLGHEGETLDIFFLEAKDIARLKARFIKKKTEPNILSFPEPLLFPHPETKKKYLGEIYLNKDIIIKSPGRAAPLLIHGILHLLGHSHRTKESAVKMERLEKKVFAQLFRVKSVRV